MKKRYVTHKFAWNAYEAWGVWDKQECKWIVKNRATREEVLDIANQMNKEQEKGNKYMKFVITKTSSDKPYVSIRNFETIDQLMKFKKQVKHDLVITSNFFYKENDIPEIADIPYAIEIYDDYRE